MDAPTLRLGEKTDADDDKVCTEKAELDAAITECDVELYAIRTFKRLHAATFENWVEFQKAKKSNTTATSMGKASQSTSKDDEAEKVEDTSQPTSNHDEAVKIEGTSQHTSKDDEAEKKKAPHGK